MSLRTRVVGLTVGMTALVLVLIAVPVTLLVTQVARDSVSSDVRASAQSAADYLSGRSTTESSIETYLDTVNQRDSRIRVAAAFADSDQTLGDQNLPDDARPGRGDGDGDGDDGERDGNRPPRASVGQASDGEVASVSVFTPNGLVNISAYADGDAVRESALPRLLLLAAAAAGLLVLAAVAAELMSRRLVHSLTATADVADRLGSGELDARAGESGPREVRAVGTALNRLAHRIDELILTERETVADLSHRLRTPLTAVRLETESLPEGSAKEQLTERVDTLERTLDAVIRAARRGQREGADPHVSPTAVITDRLEFWAPLAEDQGRTVALELDEHLPDVRCAAEDLAAAIDALLENAVAHTDEGLGIEVRAHEADGRVRVEILDEGPGLPDGALARGRSDRGGTGLGLDIARQCAEASGGALEASRAEDGRPFVALILGTRT